ncbi:MAG TPA: MFS transporter [Thermoanaerobaculia bacterium]|nr:MFS transporter [Thermoanaerobaculia bacterium]
MTTDRQSSRLFAASVAGLLYFSEGLPFGIVNDLLPVYLRVHHVELTTIGFLSTVASAWTLKVFWSPLVDSFGTYRRWIATAVLAMAICMAAMAVLGSRSEQSVSTRSNSGRPAPAGGSQSLSPPTPDPRRPTPAGRAQSSSPTPDTRTATPAADPRPPTPDSRVFWTIITIFAIASATQDLAVDAFTIRATPPDLIGPVNSIRVAAYRAALIVGGGGLVALSGVIGWSGSFAAAAVIAGIVFVVALRLPDDRGSRNERKSVVELFRGLGHWLARPRAGVLLAIVLLYRLGELAIYAMIKPYWVDRGYSAAEIGTITAVIGVIVSILGAIAGGAIVAHIGLYRAMLWLGAAQILSNLGYAIVATTHAGRWAIYAAAIVENIGYGLGTGAFLAFLMAICDRERAATEYAMLTAAFGLTRVVIGTPSGWIAQNAGYPAYFWLTVALGIPGLLLVPFVREQIRGAVD